MAKFYLAGRWQRREEFRQYKKELEALGGTCTARWLDRQTEWSPSEAALQDLTDILDSDVVIHFTEDDDSIPRNLNTGGRHVEFGIVLTLQLIEEKVIRGDGEHNIHNFIVGPEENVFNALACQRWDNWGEFINETMEQLSNVPAATTH